MSAFVCIFERSGGTVDPDELTRLAAPLEPYGSEINTFCKGPVGIAVRHRGRLGSLPRHGPLVDPKSGRVVAVAGRFAPVGEHLQAGAVESTLGRYEPTARAIPALAPFSREEDMESGLATNLLGEVWGAFVLIAAHPERGWIELARDHLGSSKLYYRIDHDRLLAASEPAAILRHSTVSTDLDELSIARFLGFRFGLSERSYFREILELPPAHLLRVTPTRADAQRYWRFAPSIGLKPSPRRITAAFRRSLGQAIAEDMAGLKPDQVALSLSGGLDSTALAALAPRGLQAFSWTFDEDPAADERHRIESVSQHLRLPIHWVSGDGLHPLCEDFVDRFVDENSPYLNPFSALKHRLYEAARAAGCERVLVGDGGDAHFAASEYWLRDTLFAGRPGGLWSLAGTAKRAVRGGGFARRSLRRILPLLPTPLRRHPAPWLTAEARHPASGERPSPILPPGGNSARHELIAGVKQSELESEEQRLFARCGVERGNPFWSWPLLKLTIHLPAGWYHRDTRSKVLTREALRGRLPDEVLEGGHTGSLGNFFLRGLQLRRQEVLDQVFRRPRSDWPRYVRREWVEPFVSSLQSIAFGHTILWRVISYELWFRRLMEKGRRGEATPARRLRAEGPRKESGQDAPVVGLAHGVALRGSLPESFKPYLLPAGDGVEAADSIEVRCRQVDQLPALEEIWAEQVPGLRPSAGGRFALVREGDGFGLLVADQGRGLFSYRDGRIEIAWTAEGTAAPHYFFSYALPLWLETQGVPVVHGSSVRLGDHAVAFVGPSGVGKSVLAADLGREGCSVLTDDGLALRRDRVGGGWLTFQGPPLLRLWPSALRLLQISSDELPRVHSGLEKRQFSLPAGPAGGPGSARNPSPAVGVPLAAIYILDRRSEGEALPELSPMPPSEALVRLVEHSLAAGPADALGLSAQRFDLLADVAENVPTRRLRLPTGAGSADRIREAIVRDLKR